jgi:hypothetical protein
MDGLSKFFENPSNLSLITTILGWFIIITNTRFLSRRSEAQDLFKLLRDFINKAYAEYEVCIARDCSNGKLSQTSEARMHAAISDIEAANRNLRTYYETGINNEAIFKLRMVALKDNFGAKPGLPSATFDQRLVAFRTATSTMNYTLFDKNYRFLADYRLRGHAVQLLFRIVSFGRYRKTWPPPRV